jgi:hypothetical protein
VSLERIVRPFVTLDVTPPQRIIDPAIEAVPNLVLQIGMEGTIKTLNGSYSASINGYTDSNNTELSRETSVKRVTNPDDPSQFVDVEVVNKLTVEKGKQDTYQKSSYEFNNK